MLTVVICSVVYFATWDSSPRLHFNVLHSTMSAAAPPDLHSVDISLEEMNELLQTDISQCIPEDFSNYFVRTYKQYFLPDVLNSVKIRINEPNDISTPDTSWYQKNIMLSICNEKWSTRSFSSVDYIYHEPFHIVSYIGDIPVECFTIPADEWPKHPIYIAKFKIGSLEYYIEARDGIERKQFSKFVANIIRQYNDV